MKRLWTWLAALFAFCAAGQIATKDWISMFVLCMGGLTFLAMSNADHGDLG